MSDSKLPGASLGDEQLPDGPRIAFKLLDNAGIWYAVWKDVTEVERFDEGDCELDVYIDDAPDHLEVVLRHAGYARYQNWWNPHRDLIEHYIRFHNGQYFHLHVHHALLTGDHFAKEFNLAYLFQEESIARTVRNGIWVVDEQSELLIGVVRLIAKSQTPEQIHPSEVQRLRVIATEELLDRVIARLVTRLGLGKSAGELIKCHLMGSNEGLEQLVTLRGSLHKLRELGPLRALVKRLFCWLEVSWHHRRSLANKRHCGSTPTVAIIGVDGSGKSTLADNLCTVLKRKVSCRRIYLGGNRRTYGVLTWLWLVTFLIFSAGARATGLDTFLADWVWALWLRLEEAKAGDRIRRIRLGRRLQANGVIVIYERYPMWNLFDVPYLWANGLEVAQLTERSKARVKTRLQRVRASLDNTGPPDLLVIVDTRLEHIEARRDLNRAELADITQKQRLLDEFTFDDDSDNVVRANNDRDFSALLNTVTNAVNRATCSSSS